MILITGGAGYIASHCILKLLKQGKDIVVFDNFEVGNQDILDTLQKIKPFDVVKGDLRNPKEIHYVFKKYKIHLVLHFAAYTRVEESVLNPIKYYENNFVASLNLIEAMVHHNVKKIIFSSTAAIYGNPLYPFVDEDHPKNPLNPYGESKLMVEKVLQDCDKAYGLKSISFRYFNVAGADSSCIIGQKHKVTTHLIPSILKSTSKKTKSFQIYGSDYDTKDGSCIRDYINIEDLATAHILGIDYLNKYNKTNTFNLGSNTGFSVKEVFETCQKVVKKKINVEIKERRKGDAAQLVSNNEKAKILLNWTPQKTLLETIQSAYAWELKNKD